MMMEGDGVTDREGETVGSSGAALRSIGVDSGGEPLRVLLPPPVGGGGSLIVCVIDAEDAACVVSPE